MSEGNEQNQGLNLIMLPNEHTDQVLNLNGVSFKVSAEGDIEILNARNVFAHNVEFMCVAPSQSGQTLEAKFVNDNIEVGDEMPDGSIFVGLDYAGDGLYSVATAVDGQHTIEATFNFLAQLEACGHSDWRLPHGTERKILSEQRHAGKLSGLFHEEAGDRDQYDALYWVTYGDFGNKKVGTKSFCSDNFYSTHESTEQRIAPVRSGPLPKGFI